LTIIARIEEIKDSRVKVRYCRDVDCGGCTHCSLGRSEKETILEAHNTKRLPVAVGDTVEIFLSPWKAIRAGFLVLIFPLLLFFAFYALGKHALGIEAEGVNVLLGLAGIACGFLLNLAQKKLQKEPDLPEVVRLVTVTDRTV
jgi:positive regulator of sigma E activity